jgi:hypothetical protein
MASTFPIQYATGKPSGEVGAVRANINVDTGVGAIGAGLQQLGAAFGEIGVKAKKAQDAMRLSVINREHDDLANFYSDAIGNTKKPEDAEKLIEEYKTKAGSLADKDNGEVQNAYTIGFNKSVGSSEMALRKMATAGWAKDAKGQYDFALERSIDAGNEKEGYVILQKALITEVISQPEYDYRVANMPTDIQFAQSRKLIATNPAAAEQNLSAMDPKKLSARQLDKRDSLLVLAQKTAKVNSESFTNSLADGMIKADQKKDMTPIELRVAAEDFRKQIVTSNLDGTDKMRLLKSVTTWEKDEGSINYSAINSLNQRIDQYIQSGVADQTLQADINAAKLDGSFGSRTGIVSRDSANMMKRLDAAEYKTAYSATGDIRAKLKADVKENPNSEEAIYLFDKDLREEFSAKPVNDAQAVQYAQVRASYYKNMSKKQAGELINIRASGRELIPWKELPRTQQEKDMFALLKPEVGFNKEVGWFTKTKTEIVNGWTKGDIIKAQEIWGKNERVTDEMIKQFGDYLDTENNPRFVAGDKEPIVLNDAQRSALPKGTIYMDKNGQRRRKP